MTDDAYFALFGTREREAQARILRAGRLSARLMDGNLGDIRYGPHEVLRAAAFLVRDRDWGTCAPEIDGLDVEETGERFSVRYTARFRAPDGAVLTARAVIEGKDSGELRFEAQFTADRDFETARAGFTVLHPLSGVVGAPVQILHGDGTVEQAHWPDLIEPWQPFKDIRAITHRVAAGLDAETRLEGDVFEMEDQRNWTDGSYKTYVRPLALPWPYRVSAGEEQVQAVALTLSGSAQTETPADADQPVRLTLTETPVPLPAIGIGLRADCLETDLAATDRLKDIGARHLIAHFDPLAGDGPPVLAGYAAIARRCGVPVTLELALPCRGPLDGELGTVARQCGEAGLALASLFVSPAVDRQSTPPGSRWPDCPPLEEVYSAARAAFPGVRLGGGMMSYFTELNRKRVPGDRLDYISHCTNPIVHAADDRSVMQSFEALSDVVRSVRALYPETPYRIGPSTIAMRQNPYGSATKPNPGMTRIPMANVDPRHNGRFGAAFALAYAATVAMSGLDVLTLSTLTGPFGLIAGEGEPTPAGNLRPLAAVLSALAGLAGQAFYAVSTSRPDRLLGLATGHRLLLVNITAEPVVVSLPHGTATARDLVSGAPLDVTEGILRLPPYGTAALHI